MNIQKDKTPLCQLTETGFVLPHTKTYLAVILF